MVLIIDDDAQFLDRAEKILKTGGHRPLLALSGEQAMNLMGTVGAEVTVIMVDLDLPKTSGFEVIERMRHAFPDLPIIAFSGVMQDEMLEVARYLGAQQSLRKPISADWLTVVDKAKGNAG